MKIIIDDKIPYIKGVLEHFAEVIYIPWNKTTPETVKNADALITRTNTICNKDLLEGSRVKFIATATIGYDHIDTGYCQKAGIEWTNAPGCNAESVNQYIASAILVWSMRKRLNLSNKTIGIVGAGNVGSRVAKTCEIIGMRVLLNDPPRARKEKTRNFVSLEKIKQEADIITFHVPLNMKGEDATFNMVDKNFIKSLHKKPLLINSCRGDVFDTEAIYNAVKTDYISGLIIDCWKNEPYINIELLNIAEIGTPHIAGYSKDGKANGTTMSIRSVSRFFNLGIDNWKSENIEIPEKTVIEIDGNRKHEQAIIAEAILATCDIETDDKLLRKSPYLFEKLRDNYKVRREFTAYTIKAKNIEEKTLVKLKALGFNLINKDNLYC
jgi:erythronate-4-phosphate dehydrogenase